MRRIARLTYAAGDQAEPLMEKAMLLIIRKRTEG